MKILFSIPILVAATGCIHAQTPTLIDWGSQVKNKINGNFSGQVSGSSAAFTGPITGTTGTFSAPISANGASFSGPITGATTFSGQINGAGATFSGAVSAATGTFTNLTATNANFTSVTSSGGMSAPSFIGTGVGTVFTDSGANFSISSGGVAGFTSVNVGLLTIDTSGDVLTGGTLAGHNLTICTGYPVCFGGAYTWSATGDITAKSLAISGSAYGLNATGALNVLSCAGCGGGSLTVPATLSASSASPIVTIHNTGAGYDLATTGTSSIIGKGSNGALLLVDRSNSANTSQLQFTVNQQPNVVGSWNIGPVNNLFSWQYDTGPVTLAQMDTGGNFNITNFLGGKGLTIVGPAGTVRNIDFGTGSTALPASPASLRWIARTDSAAESGGNAGSNFDIVRYADGGTLVDVPLSISRATGQVTVLHSLSASELDAGTSGLVVNSIFGLSGGGLLTGGTAIFGGGVCASVFCINSGQLSVSGQVGSDGLVVSATYATSASFSDSGGTCRIGFAAGGITCPSDVRLKTNIAALPSELSQVMKLRPVGFDWRKSGDHADGLIAQEVRALFPNAVHETPDDCGGSPCLNLSYPQLIPYLIKAIQEQQAEIDGLRTAGSK